MKTKIDFVILWVDGNDLEWQKEKNKYMDKPKEDVNGVIRYREWDNLKYWFRGVEKFAPWVNNVYFITWGHVPKWLNLKHPKLKVINHKDYIPSKYLPTFSSHPIEFNIGRIKELSEQFVLFNDDIFLIDKVSEEDFFVKGLPRDSYNEVNLDMSSLDPTFASVLNNNYRVLDKYYNKRKNMLKYPFKYINGKYGLKKILQTIKTTITYPNFKGINNDHVAQAFLKSYFDKLWNVEGELLDETCRHRFRNSKDINQYLIRYFQLMDGRFYPRNPRKFGAYFDIGDNNQRMVSCIEGQKVKCICMNDSNPNIDFDKCKKEINAAFDKILSEKCAFEK